MPLSDYAAQCDNCGHAVRDELKIGTEHDSIMCGKGGPGTYRELDQ